MNIPKRVSKIKLGKEVIKKLFLFFYLSLFKEKTCKIKIFVSNFVLEKRHFIYGGKGALKILQQKKKNENEHEEKIEMKQTKLRQKKKCTLLTKPHERTCGYNHTRKVIVEGKVKN